MNAGAFIISRLGKTGSRLFRNAAFLSLLAFFASCGIEDYIYLSPVRAAEITRTLNYLARIRLPNVGSSSFTHFIIYYRIYISDQQESAEIQYSQSILSGINPSLWSDYSALEPYTHEDNITTANIDTLLRNRKYYPLELSGASIDSVLDSDSAGSTIELDFSVNTTPVLRPPVYTLLRSTGGGVFNPNPDRYFLNTPGLYSSANALNTAINPDVADKDGISGPRYTYAAMYIVVAGIDDNLSSVYSNPTLIGIFQIPNPPIS
jgi:hypothetical protein